MKIKSIVVFLVIISCSTRTKSNINLQSSPFEEFKKGNIDTINVELILKKVNYKKFVNKPVGNLLHHIGISHEKILFIQMHPLKLAFVTVIYSKEIRLDIYIEKYFYLKPTLEENESEDIWKVEDLLKEKISKIRVRNRYGKSLKEYPKKPILPII